MLKVKTRGLILGKFAPFHIGHQRLIEIALKEVDELFIVMYDCPDITRIPLNIRAGWVRALYPAVNVIEGWDAPNEHQDTLRVKRMQERYIKLVLNGRKITHFFSSEYYGSHMSESLGAIDRRTDRHNSKEGHGMYATTIRKEHYKNRNFLHSLVYKDTLIKIAFIGMPSKQQTQLATLIAKNLKTNCLKDDLADLLINYGKSKKINLRQSARKKYKNRNTTAAIRSGNEYLIYDSTSFIDFLLGILLHRPFDKESWKVYREEMREYDAIFISKDEKYGIAKGLGIDSKIFLNQLENNLESMRVKYEILEGSLKEKLIKSEKFIKSIKKKFT
jgi:HTH-type transcriptional repressor of NAD biosynthesis genes